MKAQIWKAAGLEPMGGCLCIGCLEKRIGRKLTSGDFVDNSPPINCQGSEPLWIDESIGNPVDRPGF